MGNITHELSEDVVCGREKPDGRLRRSDCRSEKRLLRAQAGLPTTHTIWVLSAIAIYRQLEESEGLRARVFRVFARTVTFHIKSRTDPIVEA